MIEIPRIALAIAADASAKVPPALVRRERLSVREVSSAAEIQQLLRDEDEFDAIYLLAQNDNLLPALHLCRDIRASYDLASTPVIASIESGTIDNSKQLFEAGVDIIVPWHIEEEQLYLQLSSLGRQKRWCSALVRDAHTSAAAHSPLLGFLDALQEGVVLLDAQREILFANQSAKTLFGSDSLEELTRLSLTLREKISLTQDDQFDINLSRADGHASSVRCAVAVVADNLEKKSSRSAAPEHGAVVRLTELAPYNILAAIGEQTARTRAIFLLLCAAHTKILHDTPSSASLSPLLGLERLLESESRTASVATVLTSLLELLDPVLGSGMTVKLAIDDDLHLALRPSQLFQLFGHILLYLCEQLGEHGQITITATPMPGHSKLVIQGEGGRIAPILLTQPLITALVRGVLKDSSPTGLSVVRTLLRELGGVLEIHDIEEQKLSISITLPVVRAK